MKKLSDLQMATASSLMAGAMQAAVIQTLIRNHVLTDEEGHEIYEQALLMLETNQTNSSAPVVFETARELIEQHRVGQISRGSISPSTCVRPSEGLLVEMLN
jgi:hypothetical protein